MFVVETQTVQVQLDRAPGVGGEALAEIVRELLRRQVVDLVIETFTCLPNGAQIGVDGLRLQPCELQVLNVAFVIAFEIAAVCASIAM